MLPSTNIQSIVGATLYGPDEEKIGRISQVLVDAGDGHPTWAEVHVGTLGRHTTYVPLHEATWEHDDVYVPYDKDLVKNAPRPDGDGGLDPTQEQELTRHYAGTATPEQHSAHPPVNHDDTAHDEAAVSDDTAAGETPAQQLDDDGVLWEERLVVSKEKVPVAKVHLETTTVTEEHEITADVRKERIAVDEQKTTPPPQI
ncbi:PRC-barrel domain-containing protein [Herbiconiux sp. A18JL235]|uniref:PRC-barrel domain-containing protein n=1 Tax=Herbiconiux sp. A18JL235 TaxID=3152363 RepID=A0AB39BM56_9MICO